MSAEPADAPILEFDATPTAIIEPTDFQPRIEGLPNRALITWMGDAFERFLDEHEVVERYRLELETVRNPVYEVELGGESICVSLANVGAPAAAGLFEAMIAIGCDTFVAIGSSGGLVAEHPPATVVVPDAAIRDEGVSYHYMAPGRFAHPDPAIQAVLRATFDERGFSPVAGNVWTTDAFFRETPAKVAARIADGAVAVDMEAASLAAIAHFRGVRIGHAVYMADTLHGDQWDPTELQQRDTNFRYQLLMTAAAACTSL